MKAAAKPWVVAISILALAASLWSIFKPQGRQGLGKEGRQKLVSTSTFSAEAVADFIGGGATVVLLSLDLRGADGLEEIRSSFETVLKERGLTVVNKIIMPEGGAYLYIPRWTLPAEYLADTISEYPDAEWIISLAGVPTLDEITDAEFDDSFPGFALGYLLGSAADLPALFRAGWVDLAIVPRFGREQPSESASPQERFTQRYQVVTEDSETIPTIAPL